MNLGKNRKIGLTFLLMAIVLYGFTVVGLPLTLVSRGETLDGWFTSDHGSINLDTSQYYEGASSIRWITRRFVNPHYSNIGYTASATGVDWTYTPIITAKVRPMMLQTFSFGYPTEYPSSTSVMYNMFFGCHAAPTYSGKLDYISAYIWRGDNLTIYAKASVYAYAGPGDAGAFLASSSEVSINNTRQWWKFPIQADVYFEAGTEYYLLIQPNSAVYYTYTTGAPAGTFVRSSDSSTPYDSFPSPLTGETGYPYYSSIQAFYTIGSTSELPSDASFNMEVVTTENGWTEYAYAPQTLSAGQWNDVSVDARTPTSGTPDLTKVRAVRFVWHFPTALTSDVQTNIDLLEIYPSGESTTLTIQSTANGHLSLVAGSYDYPLGALVQVTAIPDSGYTMDYWVLDGSQTGSGQSVFTVTMNTNHMLGAVFKTLPPQTGTLVITASNGGITAPIPGNYQITVGTSVTITATPTAGYVFKQWTSDGSTILTNPYTFTMPSATVTFNAEFIQESPPQPPPSPWSATTMLQIASLVSGGLGAVFLFKKER